MSKIIRVEKTDNYVILDKALLNNKELSWKAKGILAFMLSRPDNWVFYLDEVMKHSTDGKDSFRAGINELKKTGYVKRIRTRNSKGHIDWETVVYERPHMDKPQVDNPSMDKPQVEEPSMENPTLLSTDLSNNDLTNNNISKDSPSISKVQEIYNHYLSKDIIQHKKITSDMRTAINARLKDYSYEQVIQAIDNYATVFHSNNYWFDTKYTLADLMRPKDVRKFIDEAEPLHNFKNKQKGLGNGKFIPLEDKYDPEKDAF